MYVTAQRIAQVIRELPAEVLADRELFIGAVGKEFGLLYDHGKKAWTWLDRAKSAHTSGSFRTHDPALDKIAALYEEMLFDTLARVPNCVDLERHMASQHLVE